MYNNVTPIRVIAVDDHPLLREGIRAVLARESDISLVAEGSNGHEAVDLFCRHRPDVTLMDLQMPCKDGLDATTEIRALDPSARIIILTTYEGDVRALHAIRAGASGYLLKSFVRKQLADTIRSVRAGNLHIPTEIGIQLAANSFNSVLTPREVQVLSLAASGQANKTIATSLSISEETVKAHVSNILTKLGAKDRTHATTIAIKRGLLNP